MKDFRISDIVFSFRTNGITDTEKYSREVFLDMAKNKHFYSDLSAIITNKRKQGIVSTTIDELYVPQEMWDVGIWEKSLQMNGVALFVGNDSNETECKEIELVLQVGENPAPLSDRYIEYITARKSLKLTNVHITIVCSSIRLTELD